MQEDTFTQAIDEVELLSVYGDKTRLIGFGSFQLDIHFVKEPGYDVWWEVVCVRDDSGIVFEGGPYDPIGSLIISHVRALATGDGDIKDAIDLEVSYRLTPEDANAEHRLTKSELV